MDPPAKPSAMVQGTLDMLILKVLTLEPMHAYGISARITQMSGGTFELNAGSLFPAFRRIARIGYVRSEWRVTDKQRRAKWYTVTHLGRARLTSDMKAWESQASAISKILKAKPGDV